MAEEKWLVRAVKTIDNGFNAVGQPATLTPGMRGWMLCTDAEQAARDGRVDMLSPGGMIVVGTAGRPGAEVDTARKETPVEGAAPVAEEAPVVPTPAAASNSPTTPSLRPKARPPQRGTQG